MNAKFLSEKQNFNFTEDKNFLLQALTNPGYESEVNSKKRDYFTQGKKQYVTAEDLKKSEGSLLLQRTISYCSDTFTYSFGDDHIVDLTYHSYIKMIKKICSSLNLPSEIPLFLVAKNAIINNQDFSKIKALEENGLDLNSVFILDAYSKEKSNKLVNFALKHGRTEIFKELLDEKTINNDPGVLTSIPLTPYHPLIEEHSDNAFLFYYFDKEINPIIKENYKEMAKTKESLLHDHIVSSAKSLRYYENSYIRISKTHQLHREIEEGQFNESLKLNNVDNMLTSAFIDLQYVDDRKKYFKKLLNAFKEKNITISAKQKESIMYILIHKNILADNDLPWKLNIGNKKALIAILETLSVHKLHDTKKLGTYTDSLIFKYLDDFKNMIHKENVRKLIEKSMTESIKDCIYSFSNDHEKENLKPVKIFNEFFEYPVYKLLIESEYHLSEEFKNMFKEELDNFEDRRNKPFEESIKILAGNIDVLLGSTPSEKMRNRI